MVALQAWHGGARHTSACVAPHSGTRVRQASATASTTPITTVRGIVLMNEIARHGHHHAQRRLCAKRLSLTGFAANPLLRHACQPSSTCEPKHSNFCCNVVQHRVMNVQIHVCKQDPRQRLLHVRFPPSCCDAREIQLQCKLSPAVQYLAPVCGTGTSRDDNICRPYLKPAALTGRQLEQCHAKRSHTQCALCTDIVTRCGGAYKGTESWQLRGGWMEAHCGFLST